jgi:RNA polymerase sigma-70 factor (ECF subfamily)
MLVSQDSLTTAAIAGDRDALEDLLRRHHEELRRWVAARIGRQYRAALDADDVLQVTYMEAFLRIEQFEPVGPGAFGAWLRMIAEHNLEDAIRELKRKKRPPRNRQIAPPGSSDSYIALLASLKSRGTTPSAGAARQELGTLIEEALRKLPRDYEKVVRMYYLMEQDVEEIALEMNRSPGAVHMLKRRAHDRLAEILGGSTMFFSRGA